MTIATYHNHSCWSDGRPTLADIAIRADRLGIEELGVSDHYVLHPSGVIPKWSMPPERLLNYADAVRGLAGIGPTIRLGLEVDWFPGHASALADALGGIDFDYLIGAVHEVDGFVIDGSPAGWQKLDEDRCNTIFRQYWVRIRSLAESGLFDIVAHVDLPKKFGFSATTDLSPEIDAALDAIAANGLVTELNTAGWHKPCADAYPTLDILRGCRARGVPVTLSADAHEPDHLLRDFDRGRQRLMDAGYDQIARFAGRETRFEPL